MTASIVRPEVVHFVAEVRAALGDLSAEEVDELTGGLEADLEDALERGGPGAPASLDDPAGYAAELRSAAGLPPRREPAATHAGLRRVLAQAGARIEAQPWWPSVRDFAVAVRPAWWVLRGWVAFMVVLAAPLGWSGRVVPHEPVLFVALVACVVASVQVGRAGSAGIPAGRRRHAAVTVGNVITVLLLPVTFALAGAGTGGESYAQAASAAPADGIWANGEPVRNVFAYDQQGRLLPAVQLYDQDGHPVAVAEEARGAQPDDQGNEHELLPATNADGRQLWNAFPLREQVTANAATTNENPGAVLAPPAAPPFRSVAPLVPPFVGPSPTPSATPSATPSVTPSATPSTPSSATSSATSSAPPSASPSPSPSGPGS